MFKLVRTTRDDKSLLDLVKETALLNPIECVFTERRNTQQYKYIFPNGVWKKELISNTRKIITYSAKINGRITYFEQVEYAKFNLLGEEIHDIFYQYSNGKLWVD